jgi:hypothetical protein
MMPSFDCWLILSPTSFDLRCRGHQEKNAHRLVIDAVKVDRPGEGGARQNFTYCVVKTPDEGNRRSARRRRTRLRSGKVLDPRNAFLIDCQIYDRSGKGARIRLIGDRPVPSKIRLYEESPERLLEAKVVWRKDREIGLCFNANAESRWISKAQLAHLRGHFYAARK